jgi:hypothetical protein
MNAVYPLFVDAAYTGLVDLTSVDLRVQLLDDAAVFDATDQVLADLGSVLVGTAVTVASVSIDSGALSSLSESVTVAAPTAGDQVAAAVLYVESGSPATRRLVAWIDHAPDTTPVSLLTNGDDVEIFLPDPLLQL